jgi:hypothetical protein
MHLTSVRFARDTWRRVQQSAQENGISAGELIRMAVVAWLAQHEPERVPPVERAARSARQLADASRESSRALLAQSELAVGRNRRLRTRAGSLGRERSR